MPASMIWSMGGFLSEERSFRVCCTAFSLMVGSGLIEFMRSSSTDEVLDLDSSSESAMLLWASFSVRVMLRFLSTVSSFLV